MEAKKGAFAANNQGGGGKAMPIMLLLLRSFSIILLLLMMAELSAQQKRKRKQECSLPITTGQQIVATLLIEKDIDQNNSNLTSIRHQNNVIAITITNCY